MIRKYLLVLSGLVFMAGVLFSPVSLLAYDSECTPESGKICNPVSGVETVPDFIKMILEGVLKIGIPIVALAIIYCGFLFVAARGNPESVTKAKQALLYTLIGAAVLLGSWALAEMIGSTIEALDTTTTEESN